MVKIKIVGMLFLFFAVSLTPQEIPLYIRADYPLLLPVGETFQYSLASRVLREDIDSLEIGFFVSDEADLESVSFRTTKTITEIPLPKETYSNDAGSGCWIGLSSVEYPIQKPFQMLFELNSVRAGECRLIFGYKLYSEGSLIDEIFSYELEDRGLVDGSPIEIYERESIARKALRLSGDSFFDIKFKESENSKYLIHFWINTEGEPQRFFTMKSYGDTLFSLAKDKFGYLHCKFNTGQVKFIQPVFLGEGYWNSLAILLNKADRRVELYLNDRKFYDDSFNSFPGSEEIEIGFRTASESESVAIDMLKIWDFEGSFDQILDNKFYNVFISDSSKIISFLDFDSRNILDKHIPINGIEFNYRDIEFVASDAPIFSRSPKVSLSVRKENISLEFEPGDVENADLFEIEKSTDGRDFQAVSSLIASSDKDYYSFTDYRDPNYELVYYRVKQINKDGSEIYSGITKIGQGIQEDFTSLQNYPNPFNPITTISLDILIGGEFTIKIYDIVGNEIIDLYSGFLNEGVHTFVFDGSNLPSGIYFYEVKSDYSSRVQKMILAK